MNTDLNFDNNATTKTVRARAYVRVSLVGDRKDTLKSDAVQIDEARRYCEYLGFSFDEEASKANADLDQSGFRKSWRSRPGLIAHYEAAKRGEYDCLVFYKISRLARNVREALDMIDAFEKLGVSFHFVAERIDSTSAQGRFLRNVLLSAAEMQSEDISAFLKSTVARRAREGRLQGATPVWIKKVGRLQEARYELVPEQVDNVRRLIELRLGGTGYEKIAQRLNEEGRRTVQGKYWTGGMTFKYLQPHYLDTMLGTGYYGRGTSEEFRIPNAYPAILTQEEADRILAVQKVYSEDYGRKPVQGLDWAQNKRRKNGRYSASSIHLLGSILFCPSCGARMVPHTRSAKDNMENPVRYICPNRISNRALHANGMTMVHAGSLEDAVLRVLRGVLVMPPVPMEVKKKAKAQPNVEAVQAKIDRLVNLHLDGKLQDADFDRIYAELIQEKDGLQSVQTDNAPHEHHAQAMELAGKGELTREELRQLVLLMVEKVEAPVTMPGISIRVDRKSLRRLARVTLRFATAEGDTQFLAAIYETGYAGYRRFVPMREDAEGLKELIGERPYQRRI